MRISKEIRKKIKSKSGICLDVGCGENKQKYFVGLDKRKVPGVDIIHDVEIFPWPIPDKCCNKILLSHLWEHIKPWLSIDFMNECWRVMKLEGQLLISTPYATSHGYYQDPTHINPMNETTPTYFDPAFYLWCIYKPKPWKIVRNAWMQNGNMEVILERREEKETDSILYRPAPSPAYIKEVAKNLKEHKVLRDVAKKILSKEKKR